MKNGKEEKVEYIAMRGKEERDDTRQGTQTGKDTQMYNFVQEFSSYLELTNFPAASVIQNKFRQEGSPLAVHFNYSIQNQKILII